MYFDAAFGLSSLRRAAKSDRELSAVEVELKIEDSRQFIGSFVRSVPSSLSGPDG